MVVYLSNLTRTQISIAEAWSGDGAFLVNIQKDVEIPWILYEHDLIYKWLIKKNIYASLL
jgi:hypothetical protein